MLPRFGIAVLLFGSALASHLPAQARVHAHADLVSVHDYRWRGILRATGWNIQPAGQAGLRGHRTALAAGVWANVELGTHRDGALTDLEAGDWGLSEINVWAELSRRFAWGDLAVGGIRYQYRGRAGSIGSSEVYARLRGRTDSSAPNRGGTRFGYSGSASDP